VEISVMARRGEGVRSIAKQLGCSRSTVKRYLREQEAKRYGPREPKDSVSAPSFPEATVDQRPLLAACSLAAARCKSR
jgi:transposase